MEYHQKRRAAERLFYINTNYGKFGPFKAVLGEDAIRRKVTGGTFLDSLERFFSVWIKTFA